MKNVYRSIQKQIKVGANERGKRSAGGDQMRSFDLDAKKFSSVKSNVMFPKNVKMEGESDMVNNGENIDKKVKPIAKLKGKDKKVDKKKGKKK
jgi:hypothetical protein